MKKIFFCIAAGLAALTASAQYTHPDNVNKDMLRHTLRSESKSRTEIIIPQVNGYNVYKADLHTHTVFSDAQTTPEWRVSEAWYDGLDVISITDHIEYRPYEPKMIQFLTDYVKKNVKAENYDIVFQETGNEKIHVDLNFSVKLAQEATKNYPILVIPGTEVTRPYKDIGHFNALFTTDNNAIPDNDPMQALRNAKAQGALIQYNHPGWKRTSLDMTEFEINAYKEKLIDGIEVMNGPEFYPKAIDRAKEQGLFVTANTDIHATTESDYVGASAGRNMTLILAKEKTLEAMREALEAHRTLAYSFDQIAGDEDLLKALFQASVKAQFVRVDSKGRTIFNLTNFSSIPYAVKINDGHIHWIGAFSAVQFKAADPKVTVLNMWSGEKSHPQMPVQF